MAVSKEHIKRGFLRVVKTTAVPILVWLIMELILRNTVGTRVLQNSADIKTIFRNLVSTVAFSLAISTNLNCGRMDLSLGAQMYAGTIFGGNLALMMGWGGIGMLICAMIIGGICGVATGIIFVNMRILPMVLGLGMTLIFECICFMINRQQGVTVYGKPGIQTLSNVSFIIIVAILLIIISTYLFQWSRFGYRYRAIQGNQKLASDAGINIYTNCVLCYLIGGILVACAGVFITAYSGSLTPVLGMNSNGYVFSNMFPMILGIWIGSFCNNRQIGILMAAISVNLLTITLSKMGLGISTQNMIVYTLFLLFVIYNANKSKFAYRKMKAARIALAEETLRVKQNDVYTERQKAGIKYEKKTSYYYL